YGPSEPAAPVIWTAPISGDGESGVSAWVRLTEAIGPASSTNDFSSARTSFTCTTGALSSITRVARSAAIGSRATRPIVGLPAAPAGALATRTKIKGRQRDRLVRIAGRCNMTKTRLYHKTSQNGAA